MRAKGSDGGHNGLKNINELLGTQEYARVRVGIGNQFPRGGQIDYVLGQWTEEEEEGLPAITEHCAKMIESFVLMGTERTMNAYNNFKLK